MPEVGNKVTYFSGNPENAEEAPKALQAEVVTVNEDGSLNLKVTLDESGNLLDVENVKEGTAAGEYQVAAE
jgi:hypothetical protein